MEQVIQYNKTFQERLDEYHEVFSGRKFLPMSAVENAWSFYVDLTVDGSGWQAIWKIDRSTCEKLRIPYPTIALIVVLNVKCEDLTALVRVLGTQCDISIPENHYAPLIRLWPTSEQDNSIALNLNTTANVLDMLRFFYANLVMPWDSEQDEETNWEIEHLENRLRLYYDMKNGILPKPIADNLCALVTEAKRVQFKKEMIQQQLSCQSNSDHSDLDEDFENEDVLEMTNLHLRLVQIKNEIDILENPVLRKVVLKNYENVLTLRRTESNNVWLVFQEAQVEECMDILTKVKDVYGNMRVNFSSSLDDCLDMANINDIVIVTGKKYMIKHMGVLENGGTIKSITIDEKIHSHLISCSDHIMLDFKDGNSCLEHVTIDANKARCAVIVRSNAQLVLNNCILIGDDNSSTQQGIIVLNGARLVLNNCKITKFATALVANSGSNIKIVDTRIFNVHYGLKVYRSSNVEILSSTIQKCKRYGVCVQNDLENHEINNSTITTFQSLNLIPSFNVMAVDGEDNLKGDAVCIPFTNLKALHNLFYDPQIDQSFKSLNGIC